MSDLARRVLEGEPRAIARMITLAENCSPEAVDPMKELHSSSGNAQIIGITGVMGAGKSTLVTELALEYRKQGKSVGIIAIDPTSPFSGGALLGDRIRMMKLATDDEIFIRSMGTRGMLGGLTGAVYDVVEILDASGKDVVIVETVGVGQAEVDVIKIADVTAVVTVPGLGDSIQAIKAGIMEIADIYIVNKADRPGVERTLAEIESLVELSAEAGKRKVPVLKAVAKAGEGIPEILEKMDEHILYLKDTDQFRSKRRARYEAELIEIIRKKLMNLIFDEAVFKQRVEDLIDKIEIKEKDPYTAAEEILSQVLK